MDTEASCEQWTIASEKKLSTWDRSSVLPPLLIQHCRYSPGLRLIFYVAGKDNTLMKYDIDLKEVHVIRNLGSDCCREAFLAYVPLYLDTLEEHQSIAGWSLPWKIFRPLQELGIQPGAALYLSPLEIGDSYFWLCLDDSCFSLLVCAIVQCLVLLDVLQGSLM